MYKISVIVPIYNVEQYLRECIDSIISQTYKNLEIILINDGSTDACPSICNQYAKQDERIAVIHKKNGGLSDARNAGLDIATGDYIGFVDSDDYVDHDMYEILLSNAVKYQADISCCRYSERYEDGSTVDYGNGAVTVYTGQEGLKEYLLGKTMDPFVGNKLYAAHLFQDVRFIKGIVGEDVPANYRLFQKTHCSILDARPMYKYRQQRIGAITQKGDITQQKVNEIYNFDSIYKDCLQHCPSLKKYVLRRQALCYLGMYNKLVLHGEGFEKDKQHILCFLENKGHSILDSDFAEKQLKLAIFLLCKNPWIYEKVMKLYKMVFKVARI